MTITFISTTIGMVVGAITGAGTATAILYTKLIQREIEKEERRRANDDQRRSDSGIGKRSHYY